MPQYRVSWEIDLSAENPLQAALAAHRKHLEWEVVYKVHDEQGGTFEVDLDDGGHLRRIAERSELTKIGDVRVCVNIPDAGNPYNAAYLIDAHRRDALERFRDGGFIPEHLTFWHAPTAGGAWQITDPDEIDWRGMR